MLQCIHFGLTTLTSSFKRQALLQIVGSNIRNKAHKMQNFQDLRKVSFYSSSLKGSCRMYWLHILVYVYSNNCQILVPHELSHFMVKWSCYNQSIGGRGGLRSRCKFDGERLISVIRGFDQTKLQQEGGFYLFLTKSSYCK